MNLNPLLPQPLNYNIYSSPVNELREIQLVKNLPVAIYICDKEGYITFYNKAAAQLWGREPELGKELWCGSWKILEPDGITPVLLENCPMAITLKEKRPAWGQEIVVECPDGSRRNIMPYPDPIFDKEGNLTEAVNMLVDITELKQKEYALQESENRYKLLAAELQENLKVEEEFMSIASHELKTPVTSLSMFVEVLHEMHPEIKDDDTNFMLTRCKVQLNKLIKLIRNMLDVTKIKSGKLDFNFEEGCVDDIADEVIRDYSFTSPTYSILKRGQSFSKIKLDKSRIEQVISNIICNAIKYSSGTDKIIVTITDNSTNVQVDIQDFGIGISPENKHKVFDRFFRAHGSRNGTLSSLGIGLYISEMIIERHNGKIWFDSELGKGSVFHFTLPKKN